MSIIDIAVKETYDQALASDVHQVLRRLQQVPCVERFDHPPLGIDPLSDLANLLPRDERRGTLGVKAQWVRNGESLQLEQVSEPFGH